MNQQKLDTIRQAIDSLEQLLYCGLLEVDVVAIEEMLDALSERYLMAQVESVYGRV